MLGNAVFKIFNSDSKYETYGTVRNSSSMINVHNLENANLFAGVDVEKFDDLVEIFEKIKPDVVINCIGLVKQLSESDNPLAAIPINSLLPHRLARLCAIAEARLVHMSTDCVFSGAKGGYVESDLADAKDLYGRSKLLGEVDYPNAITLRTSIIGHELSGNRSLICWFLSQQKRVKGFRRAIFSGLPTVELAHVIKDYVIPNSNLHGLYHVSANPINKYDLLKLVSRAYGKNTDIEIDDQFVIDRSLNSTRFQDATGYTPPSWTDLVDSMQKFR